MINIGFYIRSLSKSCIYTVCSILCLVLTLFYSFILIRTIYGDYSVNTFHENYSQIHRVLGEFKDYGLTSASLPTKDIETQLSQIPEITAFTRVQSQTPILHYNQEALPCKNFFFVDPEFLDIFTFNFIWKEALAKDDDINTILISSSQAQRIFGTAWCEGETISLSFRGKEKTALRVAGVYSDFPSYTSFAPHYLVAFNTFYTPQELQRLRLDYYTLIEKENITKAEEIINAKAQSSIRYELQALGDIYFKSKDVVNDFNVHGNYLFHRINIVMLVFTMLFGFINFISLALVYYESRLKEFFIRKVYGGSYLSLKKQLFSELILLVVATLVISITLVYLIPSKSFLGFSNGLILTFVDDVIITAGYLLFLGCMVAMIVHIMLLWLFKFGHKSDKNFFNSKYSNSKGLSVILNYMKVLQLSFLMLLIVVFFTVNAQIEYATRSKLGYNSENLYAARFPFSQESQYKTLKQELLKLPQVSKISSSSVSPFGRIVFFENITSPKTAQDITFEVAVVDSSFIRTLGAKIVFGSGFACNKSTANRKKAIINRTGYIALGEKMVLNKVFNNYEIIGVIDDVYLEHLDTKVNPQLYSFEIDFIPSVLIRLNGTPSPHTLGSVETVFSKLFPDFQHSIEPVSNIISEAYEEEFAMRRMFQTMVLVFVVVIIFGLIGISNFDFNAQVHGLAVHKLYGANLQSMLSINARKQLLCFLLSLFIGLSVGTFITNNWLSQYVYSVKCDYHTLVFAALVGIFTMLAAWLTYVYKVYALNHLKFLR